MKTDRLKEFVSTNRDAFDFRQPSPDVWEKISANTKKAKVVNFRSNLIRAAAVVAVVVVSAATLWQNIIFTPLELSQKSGNPEIRELIEAEAFYAHQVSSKLKEIRKCYYTFPELKEDVENDLTELEEMYNVLKKDLKENVSNKAVIEAMIENNRYRLKLVDDVLEQINC